MLSRIFAGLVLVATMPLQACDYSQDVIANAEIILSNEKIVYYSYAPSDDNNTNVFTPNCGWSGSRTGIKQADGSFTTTEVIRLVCSFFDQPSVKYQDQKLSLVIHFHRSKGNADFALKNALIRWSRDGTLLRSTLQEGRFGSPCLEMNCGFEIRELSLPDPELRTGELRFDFFLDHNLSGNLDRNSAFKSSFRFHGKALFRQHH